MAAWERSVGRPSRNRLENGHANHHRYRITTPVLKMHLDRAATRISTYSVLAGRRWPPARQSKCRSRVARLACVSSLRPTRYHRCGTADTPCRPKLNAIRRPGCTSSAGSLASARVCGVQPKCKPTFFWGGWQKIVAQIRGVFRKIITNTPLGGQNLAQNGVFTPRF